MRKDTVNSIFIDEHKRRNIIIRFVCIIILFVALFAISICTFFIKNKKEYVKYTENSNIEYKVYLKKNDFFPKEYAEEKKQYIASLIDYVDASFKYAIDVAKEDADFNYIYYVDAKVEVKERNSSNSLYDFTETIVSPKNSSSNGSSNVNILENLQIDYNHYNNIVNSFVRTYKLEDIVSTLTINMHVETVSSCFEFDDDKANESVISLVIPLTTKTMAIDISQDLVGQDHKIVLCNNNPDAYIYLGLALIFFILSIYVIVSFSIYVAKTRTAKDIYERELKKILSNYHSFIQKVDNTFNLTSYKLVAINSFMDMLEIRDTINQPILMVESSSKDGVHFIIPSNTKILYTYTLKVKNIQQKLNKKKKEEKD